MKRQLTPAEQEIAEELEVAQLRKDLVRLKKLPKDFRDMAVMSDDWQNFARIMGREKKAEMLEWAKGGVLCLASINELERKVLTVYGEVIRCLEQISLEVIILRGHSKGYSFVYASEWPKNVITALNWLASHYGWNFRFLGQLKGQGGHALGI